MQLQEEQSIAFVQSKKREDKKKIRNNDATPLQKSNCHNLLVTLFQPLSLHNFQCRNDSG